MSVSFDDTVDVDAVNIDDFPMSVIDEGDLAVFHTLPAAHQRCLTQYLTTIIEDGPKPCAVFAERDGLSANNYDIDLSKSENIPLTIRDTVRALCDSKPKWMVVCVVVMDATSRMLVLESTYSSGLSSDPKNISTIRMAEVGSIEFGMLTVNPPSNIFDPSWL